MATPKTIICSDIETGKLTIMRNGSEITIEQRYQFVDSNGDVIREVAGGRLVETKTTVEIPADVLSALVAINNWIYQQALIQEGMD